MQIPKELHALLDAGIPLILNYGVYSDGSCRCRNATAENRECWAHNPGKHPMAGLNWTTTGLIRTLDELRMALAVEPHANFGIALGHPMKDGRILFAIDVDVDGDHAGAQSVAALESEGKVFTPTLTDRTGGGGSHRYLGAPAGTTIGNSRPRPGVDIRGLGGQVVIPPSRSNKGEYTWDQWRSIANAAEWEIELATSGSKENVFVPAHTVKNRADLTEAEIQQCDVEEQRIVSSVVEWLKHLAEVPKGKEPAWPTGVWQASKDLFRLANTPWASLSGDQAMALIMQHAPRDAGYDTERITKNMRSGARSVQNEAYPLPMFQSVEMRTWDDFGNADRFVDHHLGCVLWLHDARVWAVYHGDRWHLDEKEYAAALYREMVESLESTEALLYSDEVGDDKESQRDKFLKHIRAMRSYSTSEITLKMAASKHEIEARKLEFDADAMLFGCGSGVLDLETGALVEAGANKKISKWSKVKYVPDAKCPQFLKYLERVQPQADCREFLQRWTGYCLTGEMKSQKFVMHVGPPNGGKSVYLQVVAGILGEYHAVANVNVFHQTTTEQHLTGIAKLAGTRFIQANESKQGRRLDEAVLNMLTSEEMVTANLMHQNEFDFKPTGKINYVTNHKPGAVATSGVWRRMVLAGWDVVIPDSEVIEGLAAQILAEEAEGILAWAVQGCLKWQTDGLKVPLAWEMSKDEYKEGEDVLGRFIADKCTRAEGVRAKSTELYAMYKRWCDINGVHEKTAIVFGKEMKEAGFKQYRTSSERGFEGIKLNEQFLNYGPLV